MRWKHWMAAGCVSALVMITGCSGYAINVHTNKDAKHYKVEYTTLDAFDSLEIHLDTADVEIVPGDEYALEADMVYYGKKPEYSNEKGTLKVNQKSEQAAIVATFSEVKERQGTSEWQD